MAQACATTTGRYSCDIAIVGGGLGGLICAAAIRVARPDLNVKVFEQFPVVIKAGALLGLAPNAQKTLDAIDPRLMQQANAVSMGDGKSIAFTHEGVKIKEGVTGDIIGLTKGECLERFGCCQMGVGWWELHKILSRVQPEGSVVFNSKFNGYTDSGEDVMVKFQHREGDGSRESEWTAKVLIGADGAFSAVRRQCLDDGSPMLADVILWRARLATPEMMGLLNDGTVERAWFGNKRLAVAWMVNLRTEEGCWVFGANQAVLEEMGVDFSKNPGARVGYQTQPIGKTAHERAKRVVEGYPEEFTQLVEATDPASVVEHGVWIRTPATGRWGRGRVTLCGDAAHPLRPTTGQGFGQAAEDALALGHALREHGLTPAALRAFEDGRLQRVAKIADTEQKLAAVMYQESPEEAEARKAAILEESDYQNFLFGINPEPL
eukprot:CAMPEP_0206143986 /NCGR_PEP_ID=MMETSP1473-20131121/22587_1 /ASSEMBLY_ACC=CAM_ASM_001109 /TAXON_ID=1461547 /ORGANISM="Stichococcus sp, Strain RCC1054" /LENGTH=434 /DNA_ID=CAMNT_0053539643 /DNA_START=253 /DNA_END=1557 /DNA_ORIENTATION=-